MGAAGLIIVGVEKVFTLLGGITAIKDLTAGDAASVLTVGEAKKIITGSHAEFFKTVSEAEIESARNQIYNVMLPSITATTNIAAADLKDRNGRLWQEYRFLHLAREKLSDNLTKLAVVFNKYWKDIHTDEVMSGLFTFIRGYGILLHIHGTYAYLHHIEIGASSLDHRDLKLDTLLALQYLSDAQSSIEPFLWKGDYKSQSRGRICDSRLALYPPDGSAGKDGYYPLSSTPFELKLHYVITTKADEELQDRELTWFEKLIIANGGHVSKDPRTGREKMMDRVKDLIIDLDVTPLITELRKLLEERLQKQGVCKSEIKDSGRFQACNTTGGMERIENMDTLNHGIGGAADAREPEPQSFSAVDAELATPASKDAASGN